MLFFIAEHFCSPNYLYADFKNGEVNCTDADHELSICTFSCNEGYHIKGESQLHCTEEGWDHDMPNCTGQKQ